MQKKYLLLLALALLLLIPAARADTYNFMGIYMTMEVPVDPYAHQLTPDNLANNEAYIASLGETVESMKERFAAEGILLMAFDEQKGRTLIVSAVQDEQSQALYDINEQTPETRATYRVNHANGTFCGDAGYKFETCEWKNFGDNQGRFLMMRYNRKIDGKVVCRGLWRRTIRNGYTITLDLRVEGRQVASGDITALNKLQDSLSFMQITAMPDAPLSLAFTAPPPESSNTDTFTIKGATRPGAAVVAAYVSLRTNQSKMLTATADGKGAFALEVTLPAVDYYNMIITATVNEGLDSEESVSQEFSVEYDPAKLPVTFISPLPETFTGDSFKLAGTTLTGVSIQLLVNGELKTVSTGNNRTFSFTIDTSREGDYDIQLTFTKNNYNTKVYNYHIRREAAQTANE